MTKDMTAADRFQRDHLVNRALDDELLGGPIHRLEAIPGPTVNPTPPGSDKNGDGIYYGNIEKREHGDAAIVVQEMAPAKKRGRPPRILSDKELRQLDVLSSLHCTYAEISDVLDVDDQWLAKNFSDRIEANRSTGRMSLRRKQFQKAIIEEDTIMQIFLGKNILGQSDKRDVSHAGPDGGPIQHQHTHTVWSIGGRDLSFKG